MRMPLRSIVVLALVAAGCRSADLVGPESTSPAAAPVRLVSHLGQAEPSADDVTIEHAALTGDTLRLRVSYPGGCRVHGFRLVASSETLAADVQKVGMRLAHDPYGDLCRNRIPHELAFDLRPLRDAAANARGNADAVVLVLDGREIPYSL